MLIHLYSAMYINHVYHRNKALGGPKKQKKKINWIWDEINQALQYQFPDLALIIAVKMPVNQ